jgi:uncharacterized repeat protein (TIGR01451 family)
MKKWLMWCAVIIAVVGVTGLALFRRDAQAVSTPFALRFSANTNGNLTTIGNNLSTCLGTATGTLSVASCNALKTDITATTASNNDNWTGATATAPSGLRFIDADSMVDANNDGVDDTFNSSSSDLQLPSGATVLFAGLYWGARLSTAAQTGYDEMQLRTPNSTNYQTITADQIFGPLNVANGDASDDGNAYQGFADVTDLVAAGGDGTYWGANVVSRASGQTMYTGWSLVVAYSAPNMPLRNLTVFDGFQSVRQGSNTLVTTSGFLTPTAGTVNAALTMVAYEGDRNTPGDSAVLNGTPLSTAISPSNNFFNSVIDTNGSLVTTRNPAYANTLGYDIKNLTTSGVLLNSTTSATFEFSTNNGVSNDIYYPGVLGFAIDLDDPFIESEKTVTNLSGHTPAETYDTLEYSVQWRNTMISNATSAVSTDALPPHTTYVPGSLRYIPNSGATPIVLTDAGGDDRGEYDAAMRTVTVRMGPDATGSLGGTIGFNDEPRYTFQVTLDPEAQDTVVSNIATLDYEFNLIDVELDLTKLTNLVSTEVVVGTPPVPDDPTEPTGPKDPVVPTPPTTPIIPAAPNTGYGNFFRQHFVNVPLERFHMLK